MNDASAIYGHARLAGKVMRGLRVRVRASRVPRRERSIMRPAEIRASLRQRAEECLRLSRELPNIEHKFLALGMANAWILLAEMADRLAGG